MVSGLSGTTYLERLKEVGLTTLELRRQRGDMIQVWKILHQKDDVDPQTWFKMASESDRHTRQSSNPWNLSTGTGNNDVRLNFFSIRVVEQWNSLPDSVKSAETMNSFKNSYDSHIAA